MTEFIPPSITHRKALALYRREVLRTDGDFDGTAGLGNFDDITDWLELVHAMEPGRAEKYGYYPTIVCLAFNEDYLTGIFNVRLCDDDLIRNGAGHIGYHVRPTERRKGYGGAMLDEAVRICRIHGIAEPVVCADPANYSSKRTALSRGFTHTGENVTESGITVSKFVLMSE